MRTKSRPPALCNALHNHQQRAIKFHKLAKHHHDKFLDYAIESGRHLFEVQKELKKQRGEWTKWIRKTFGKDARSTPYNYIRLYENPDKVDRKLTYAQNLKLIAGPAKGEKKAKDRTAQMGKRLAQGIVENAIERISPFLLRWLAGQDEDLDLQIALENRQADLLATTLEDAFFDAIEGPVGKVA